MYKCDITDVSTGVSGKNAQISARQIDKFPASKEQQLNATVAVQSRLQTPEQFGNIRLRTTEGGAVVRLRDVARVELGAELYGFDTQYNGKPASGFGVQLASGANALDTVAAVKAEVQDRKSVVWGKSVSVRVELGGRRNNKKK